MKRKQQSDLFKDLVLVAVSRIDYEDIKEHGVRLSFEGSSGDVVAINVDIAEETYDEYDFTTYNGERLIIE